MLDWILVRSVFRAAGPHDGLLTNSPGISAWYPPVGIALALLLGMGPKYAPLYWLAGFISSRVNYHQTYFSYTFLLGNSLDFGAYTVLSIVRFRIPESASRSTSSARYLKPSHKRICPPPGVTVERDLDCPYQSGW